MSELGKMKARYADLHGQIDQMTKLMEEKQVKISGDEKLNLVKKSVEYIMQFEQKLKRARNPVRQKMIPILKVLAMLYSLFYSFHTIYPAQIGNRE